MTVNSQWQSASDEHWARALAREAVIRPLTDQPELGAVYDLSTGRHLEKAETALVAAKYGHPALRWFENEVRFVFHLALLVPFRPWLNFGNLGVGGQATKGRRTASSGLFTSIIATGLLTRVACSPWLPAALPQQKLDRLSRFAGLLPGS